LYNLKKLKSSKILNYTKGGQKVTKEIKKNKNVVWTSLPVQMINKIDAQCETEKRTRPQLLRIIIEDYYLKTKKKGG
jgi:hypothetical protein